MLLDISAAAKNNDAVARIHRIVTASCSNKSGFTYLSIIFIGALMDFIDYMWGKLIVLALIAFVWGFIKPTGQHPKSAPHDTAQIPEDR